MSWTSQDVQSLLGAFDSRSWFEMNIVCGTGEIHVSRRPAVGGPDTGLSGDDSVHRVSVRLPSSPELIELRSPSIGVFRRAGSPDAPPVAEVGLPVRSGDPVGFVEVMDRVIPVVAPIAGAIEAVLAADGETVEYGERLALVAPAEGGRGLGNG